MKRKKCIIIYVLFIALRVSLCIAVTLQNLTVESESEEDAIKKLNNSLDLVKNQSHFTSETNVFNIMSREEMKKLVRQLPIQVLKKLRVLIKKDSKLAHRYLLKIISNRMEHLITDKIFSFPFVDSLVKMMHQKSSIEKPRSFTVTSATTLSPILLEHLEIINIPAEEFLNKLQHHKLQTREPASSPVYIKFDQIESSKSSLNLTDVKTTAFPFIVPRVPHVHRILDNNSSQWSPPDKSSHLQAEQQQNQSNWKTIGQLENQSNWKDWKMTKATPFTSQSQLNTNQIYSNSFSFPQEQNQENNNNFYPSPEHVNTNQVYSNPIISIHHNHDLNNFRPLPNFPLPSSITPLSPVISPVISPVEQYYSVSHPETELNNNMYNNIVHTSYYSPPVSPNHHQTSFQFSSVPYGQTNFYNQPYPQQPVSTYSTSPHPQDYSNNYNQHYNTHTTTPIVHHHHNLVIPNHPNHNYHTNTNQSHQHGQDEKGHQDKDKTKHHDIIHNSLHSIHNALSGHHQHDKDKDNPNNEHGSNESTENSSTSQSTYGHYSKLASDWWDKAKSFFGGKHHHHHNNKGHKNHHHSHSEVTSKIFGVSISVLGFLAFGLYVLMLLFQAAITSLSFPLLSGIISLLSGQGPGQLVQFFLGRSFGRTSTFQWKYPFQFDDGGSGDVNKEQILDNLEHKVKTAFDSMRQVVHLIGK